MSWAKRINVQMDNVFKFKEFAESSPVISELMKIWLPLTWSIFMAQMDSEYVVQLTINNVFTYLWS